MALKVAMGAVQVELDSDLVALLEELRLPVKEAARELIVLAVDVVKGQRGGGHSASIDVGGIWRVPTRAPQVRVPTSGPTVCCLKPLATGATITPRQITELPVNTGSDVRNSSTTMGHERF